MPPFAPGAPGARVNTLTSDSGSGYGSGLSSTPFTTLKTAVFAPMASPSVRSTAIVNVGFRRSARAVWRRCSVSSHPIGVNT